jgi:hypothetical protein
MTSSRSNQLVSAEPSFSAPEVVVCEDVEDVPISIEQLGGKKDPRGADLTWLIVSSSSRPVLPLEHIHFRARHAHICDALRLCWEKGLLVASISHTPPHGTDDSNATELGTALLLEGFEEKGDHVEVKAVGVHPFTVKGRGTLSHRRESDGKARMLNIAAISWMMDADCTRSYAAASLRAQVMELLAGICTVPVKDAPCDVAAFSWWAAARLPLPPPMRALLLRIPDPMERLSTCATFLTSAARLRKGAKGGQSLVGRRSKL